MISRIFVIVGVFVCLMLVPTAGQTRMVHDFDCTFCHYEYSSEEQPFMTFNVCLVCHAPGKETATYTRPDGSSSDSTSATFVAGDSSNALGSNAAADAETSHFFTGGSDTVPAAGATPPTNFRFNLGWANGQITCSRCHNPHGDTNNPKLLKLGVNSTEAMCLDCHDSWNQTGNHGLTSHPLHDDYPTLAANNPEKFKAVPDNFGTNGGITLVDGTKASCSSCHGVHFVDSDATTADGVGASLSDGDGKLLKFAGPSRENTGQSLCQTCHLYTEHGADSGLGCMVCHGGHEYDPGGDPNYYMLKKQITLASVPKYNAAGTVNLDYTTYPPPANLGGICLECHALPVNHEADSSCNDCHSHGNGFAHGSGSTGVGCVECHGHDAGTLYDADMQAPYTAGEAVSQGKGTFQSHSTHTELTGTDARGPGIYCDTCHDINNFPLFADGKNLEETTVCDSCHSSDGPFNGIDDGVPAEDSIGAKKIWKTGAYISTEGSTLIPGKEKWCVSCHDSGTSVIGGRQAPDVAGGNDTFGYYQSGHGAFFTECGECHTFDSDHNFDNRETYDIDAADRSVSYKQGFRLIDIDGGDPFKIIPYADKNDCYNKPNYALCFSCHDDQTLLQLTSAGDGCEIPYGGAAAVTTGFRDESRNPTTNLHNYHLLNKFINSLFDSDGDGTYDSMTNCMSCHNPHGPSRADGSTPTVRMTTREIGMTTGTDGTGDYGMGPGPGSACSGCHTNSKYYRAAPPEANPTRPATPANDSPDDGAIGLTQPLIVDASDFFDTDGNDTHKASQWQFSSAAGSEFETHLIYDSGAVAASTTHLPAISWAPGATYSWRVRYQDNHGIWSEYSTDTSFTLVNDAMPDQPVNLTPAQGAVNVNRQVVLEAEPFSDTEDAGPNPQNSIWQVSTSDGAGFWEGMVHNSTSVPGSTSYAVPVQLEANRRYYWRTRSQDSAGNWSSHSEITSFTTNSLITKFSFEEDSGSTVFDSEEDNDGTLVGGATRTTGFSGRGLDFDGTTGEMAWSYENENPRDSFTMEAMVKATTTHQIDAEAATGTAGNSGQKYVFYPVSTGTYDPAGAGVSVGTNGISVYEYSAPVAIYDPSVKSPIQPQLGTDWHHVVVTYTETRPRIYLDGKLVHLGLDSSRASVFAPIQLGHGFYGGFSGTVDEVAIYNKALTKAEVLQRCLELGRCTDEDIDHDAVNDAIDNCPVEYNPDQTDSNGNGIGNVCDYQGYWKLDEGSGYIAADEAGRNHASIGSWEHWTAGVAGGYAFAGNGSFNRVEVDNLLDNHSGDFSVSVWLKFPDGTTNPKWSLTKGDPWGGTGFGIAHWDDAGNASIPPGFFLNDGTPDAAHRVSLYASSIPRDTWGHFTWTVDRANQVMKVYKNGEYEGSVDISVLGTNAITGEGVFDFATPSSQFTGALDNVAVYDFVLQSEDVQARFENDLSHFNEPPPPYSISLSDNDSSDPAAAEEGYTNDRSITITTNSVGATPTEMEFAEDLSFTSNATGWLPFNSTHTYLLSDGDGTRTLYGRLKTADGEISPLRATIVLDTLAPTVSNSALTRPNGTETWVQGTSEELTWTPEEISDAHIKDAPVALGYSTDGGSNFDNQIAIDEANDGSYLWNVAVEDSATVQVQLTATDKAGNQSRDSSDTDFAITPVTPVLLGISVADNNDADPAPAETGYTNKQSVEVSLSVSNFPTQMLLAEDAGFSVNATGWIPYSASYTYNLTVGDGSKTVYAKLKNASPGESAVQNDTIVLDTVAPAILAGTLTSPNGHATNRWQADFLTRGTDQTITWSSTDISDINLKTSPVFLRYATDPGGPWSTTIAGNEGTNIGETNDGSYLWTVDADYTHYARIQLAARDKAGNEATDIADHDFNISPLPGYIVTNTNDSGAGSLRQALTDLNAAGGNSPIWFNIPGSDANVTNGVAIINAASGYSNVLGGTLLDGTSQTVLRGDSNTNGPEVRVHYTGAANINGLTITGDSSGVRDLQITEFYTGIHVSGANASIQGSQLGFFSDSAGYGSSPNSIDVRFQNGSVATVTDNSFACSNSGVSLSGTPDVRIENNTIGLFPDGTECSVGFGVTIFSSQNPRILSNIINTSSRGISTSGYSNNTSGATIQGNQIGAVYRAGSWTNLPGPTTGIHIESVAGGNHLIGGGTVASSDDVLNQSNVISADNIGIDIVDVHDHSTEIHGNFIGTNPEQDEVFPGTNGILINFVYIYGLDGVTVGGGGAGQAGNVIANMSEYGIKLEGDATLSGSLDNHVFSRNSFYNNGDDAGDDAIYLGAKGNGGIARPVAILTPDNKLVVNDVYGGYSATTGDIIEVFIADFEGTEYGEGKEFITSAQASGAATSITIDLSQLITDGVIQQGDWLTITKTNVFNGTTAFSENVRLTGSTAPSLDWTGGANYTDDGVDPNSAAQNSNFTFQVDYVDDDNDSPWPIEVWIDVNDDGSYAADEKFAMTEVDAGDVDYSDGKLYTYTMALPYVGDGIRKYRFYASDANLTATGVATGDKTFEVINDPPVTPSNVTPGPGATDVMQPPTLVASAYANTAVDELAGDYHQASQWLISSVSGDFSAPNLLYNSGTVIATNSHDAAFAWAPGTTYHWTVRYQDDHGEWSAYSTDTSFTTFNNTMPDQPTNVTPAAGTVDVPLLPTLTADAYSDTDSDAHQASTWQISLAGGARFDTAIVYNNVTGPETSHPVTSSLTENNRYFWRVRYQDTAGQWSAWSIPTEFFVPTSLVTMFTFDNDSGTVAEDVYGVYNGAVLNGALWTAGFSGQGLTLDGIDDLISLSYAGGVPPANDFTLEAMVKATGTHQIDTESTSGAVGTGGQNYLFGADYVEDPGAGAGVSMGTNGISVYEHSGGYMPAVAVYDPAAKDPVQPQLGTDWNHVVVSYTDKQSRIYLNGQLVHTGLTSPRTDVFAPTKLGSMGYGAFAGIVDEVSIYNSALTDTEVMQHCIAVGQCSP